MKTIEKSHKRTLRRIPRTMVEKILYTMEEFSQASTVKLFRLKLARAYASRNKKTGIMQDTRRKRSLRLKKLCYFIL